MDKKQVKLNSKKLIESISWFDYISSSQDGYTYDYYSDKHGNLLLGDYNKIDHNEALRIKNVLELVFENELTVSIKPIYEYVLLTVTIL